MRIGVGHPGNKDMVSNWVLNKFHPTDKDAVLYNIGGLLVIENLHDKHQ